MKSTEAHGECKELAVQCEPNGSVYLLHLSTPYISFCVAIDHSVLLRPDHCAILEMTLDGFG